MIDPTALRLARQRQRITVEQAALMLDLSEQDYKLAEEGIIEFSDSQLKKLAIFLRIEPKPPVKKKKPNKRAREKRDRAQREIDPEYISEEELEDARKNMPDATPEHLRFLRLIANIVVENTLADLEQAKQLEAEPGGFHPERSLPCKICGENVSGEKAWFDHNGQQCMPCHQAIKDGIIPADLTAEDFYTEIQLDIFFTLNRKMINQLIKAKHLVARKAGRLRLFLHSDNPNFFPPKELLKGDIVKDGDEYVFPPWYMFTDPNEVLKDYGMGKVMRWG